MENQHYPVAKHSFMYGIYTSIVLIILTLVFYVLDLYAETWPAFLSYAALLAGVVMASISYRDKRMNGFVTYGQSFSAGFMAGLIASVVAGIFSFIFISVLGDDYTQMLLQKAEERMLEQRPDMSDEEFDMAMKFTENMMKPWWMAFMGLLNFVFFSLVFSLIASIFIKRQKPEGIAE